MAEAQELIAQQALLEKEASAIIAENERLATLKTEVESRTAAITQKQKEAEQAKAQLEIARRTQSDTARYELLLKQKQAEVASEVERTTPLIEGYNKAGQVLNLRSEVLKSKAEEFNMRAGEYNKKQEEFGSYLKTIAEGRESPQTVRLYQNISGDILRTGGTTDVSGRYSEGEISLGGEDRPEQLASIKRGAIEKSKGYLGVAADDIVFLNNELIQASSLSPEQLDIARNVFSGRQSALAQYERERELEQDRLKTGMLIGGTATFAQPASFIEAYKAIVGSAPTAAQVNITPYVMSEEQLRAKAIMLSSPTAQFGSGDIYASEYAKIKERIGFAPAIERDEPGQIKFYGVEGSPGVQWSKQANEARLAEINRQIVSRDEPNIIITSPEGIKEPSLKESIEAGMIPYTGKSRSEVFGAFAENVAIGTKNIFGLASQKAKAAIDKRTSPGYVRGVATGIVDVGVSVPMIVAGGIELPAVVLGRTATGTLGEHIERTASEAPEVIISPITAIKEAPSFAESAGLATAYIGTALVGSKAFRISVGGGAKVVVSDIKRGATFSEGKVPAFPGYVWLKKTKLKDGTVIVKEEVVDLRAREAAIEKVSGKPSREGLITIVKPKAEVKVIEPKVEAIDLKKTAGETTYEKQFRESQGNQYGKFETQWDVEQQRLKNVVQWKEPYKPLSKADSTRIEAEMNRLAGVKAELNLGGVSEVMAVPIIITGQKDKAVLKTEAPTIQIARTGLEMRTAQEAKATTISVAIQKSRTGQRQEAPEITVQKQKERYVPVIIAKTVLGLKTTPDIGQIIRMDKPTITKTTEITTPKTPQIPRTPRETPPRKPPKKLPTEEVKEKSLNVGLKKRTPKMETPKKAGKDDPLYPASFEFVTAEEFELGGKRAKHIKERKVTQELFEELKKGGRSIPTARQFKRHKAKG